MKVFQFIRKATPSGSTLRVGGMTTMLLVAMLAGGVTLPAPPGADDGSSASISTSPVGSAEALNAQDVRNFSQSALGGAVEFWIPMGLKEAVWGAQTANDAVRNMLVQKDDYEQNYSDMEAQQQQLDIHANSRIGWDKANNLFATVDNYNSNSRDIAWGYVKKAVVEELNSGGTENSAKTRAKSAIRDFYTIRQNKLVTSYKQTLYAAQYNQESYRTQHGSDYIRLDISNTRNAPHDFQNPDTETVYDINDTITKSYTLANGTTVQYPAISVDLKLTEDLHDYENTKTEVFGLKTETYPSHSGSYKIHDDDYGDTDWTYSTGPLIVPAPTEDHSDITALDFTEYASRMNELEAQKNQMVDNADAFVESTYNETMAGEINESEYLTADMLADDYSIKYNETGWYAYAVAQSALLGSPVPDLNETALMNVSVDGNKFSGLISGNMSEFNRSLAVNETYNLSSTGTYYLITEGGDVIDLAGESITITDAQARSGEDLSNVDYRHYNYQTTDATKLKEELQQINELQAEIEEMQDALAAQGGGLDLGNLGPKAIGIGLIGAAALIGRSEL